MGAESSYLEWKRRANAVSCRFARFLAMNADGHGQRLKVLQGAVAKNLAARVDAAVTEMMADPEVSAATLLLPKVTELRTLAEMAVSLSKLPDWNVRIWQVDNTPVGAVVAFGISRSVPLVSGQRIPSEALVMGPFNEFPPTRRAPVPAFEMFVGNPPAIDPKTGVAPVRANLAHIQVVPPLDQRQFDGVWTSSVRVRNETLGNAEDDRAKARVSFSVPPALALELGCSP